MTTDKPKQTTALYIATESSHSYFHIRLYVVTVENGQLATDWNYGSPGRALKDTRLEVNSQGSGDDVKGLYAFGFRFDMFKPEVGDLERALKIGKALERKLSKLQDEFGYPQTFSQYCGYVAKALGIKSFATRSKDGDDVKLMDTRQGLYQIQYMEAEWLEAKAARLTPVATAANQ